MKSEKKKRQKKKYKQRMRQRRRVNLWKEFWYNCPYLIVIVATSFVVMIFSDEIGIKAIARETENAVVQTMAKSARRQKALMDLVADGAVQEALNLAEQNVDAAENAGDAGKSGENKNAETNNNNLNNDIEGTENGDNMDESPVGVTNFTYYDPQATDSRYYSDAGKVALTTEYPYMKENDSYFNDAAFLGDSRTLGISDYAGLDAADFYCDSGMMIFKLLEEEVTYQKTGEKVLLTDILTQKQYGKIYIMLGMNELGYGNTQTYLEQYRKVVEQIQEWQPGAIIYIMANLHVSKEKNNIGTEFNNININDKNAASAGLANGTDIFYLDANPLFTDEEGFLNEELTFDGVHLYAQHYDVWRQFLLEHAVEPKKAVGAGDKDLDAGDSLDAGDKGLDAGSKGLDTGGTGLSADGTGMEADETGTEAELGSDHAGVHGISGRS